jgi:hypothetical protein
VQRGNAKFFRNELFSPIDVGDTGVMTAHPSWEMTVPANADFDVLGSDSFTPTRVELPVSCVGNADMVSDALDWAYGEAGADKSLFGEIKPSSSNTCSIRSICDSSWAILLRLVISAKCDRGLAMWLRLTSHYYDDVCIHSPSMEH